MQGSKYAKQILTKIIVNNKNEITCAEAYGKCLLFPNDIAYINRLKTNL